MSLPDKLIGVGMRYLPPENRKILEKYRGRKDNVFSLVLAENPSGVRYCGNCYAVEIWADSKLVGYVRNQDLSQGFLDYMYKVKKTVFSHYQANLSVNYFVLMRQEEVRVNSADLRYYKISDITDTTTKYTVTNSSVPTDYTLKEEKMAINTNSMRDSFFREVKNVAIDIQSGKFGVVTNEGICVYTDGGISVNPITDFGVKVPAFAMRVAVSDLKAGDIIVGGTEPAFFVETTTGGYTVVNMAGERKTVGSVTNMFFGKNTVLAVKNMFGEGTNPMMMAMLMGDNKDGFDMKTFALMSMMGGGQMDSNMLMMAMLLGNK